MAPQRREEDNPDGRRSYLLTAFGKPILAVAGRSTIRTR